MWLATAGNLGCGQVSNDENAREEPGPAGAGSAGRDTTPGGLGGESAGPAGSSGGSSGSSGSSSGGAAGGMSGAVGLAGAPSPSTGGAPNTSGQGGAPVATGGQGSAGAAGAGGAEESLDCTLAKPYAGTGRLNLQNQQDLDELPLLSEISGDVHIASGVEQLGRLACLRRVTGTLSIKFSSLLTSLDGLEQLQFVGDLVLERLGSLFSLSGLSGLSQVERDLIITENPTLGSLAGLGNLSHLGRDLTVTGNTALTELGMPKLTGIYGNIIIHDNPTLKSVALPQLRTGGGLRLGSNNAALKNLLGLERLEELGPLEINATSLVSLDGLSALRKVRGDFYLSGNQELERIGAADALNRLRDVSRFYILSNPALVDLGGLAVERADELLIVDNAELASLHGLENLRAVQLLGISTNAQLRSLAALESLASVSTVTVLNNPRLPACQANALLQSALEPSSSSAEGNTGTGPCP